MPPLTPPLTPPSAPVAPPFIVPVESPAAVPTSPTSTFPEISTPEMEQAGIITGSVYGGAMGVALLITVVAFRRTCYIKYNQLEIENSFSCFVPCLRYCGVSHLK